MANVCYHQLTKKQACELHLGLVTYVTTLLWYVGSIRSCQVYVCVTITGSLVVACVS